MDIVDLRNLDEARTYLMQGLWLQRVVKPTATLVKSALEWADEIASSGQPLPPIGFVADLGNVVYGNDRGRQSKELIEVPGWPSTLARSYEDYLLGKIYADWTFERATDALRRYTGRDQAKGLAYVVKQIRERGQLGGVELSPAVIRGMKNVSPEEVLQLGYESLSQNGPMPILVKQYEALVSASRRMAEVLGPEDVIALEQRTALADMGQYVAHRQILQMTAKLEALLPPRPVKPLSGRKEVPTRIMDEDQYPVGGYTSISTRGSIESLLHSQLAYMEDERSIEPDLFQLKFVRDELFYYSRDENQFLRRRRLFVMVFPASLQQARFKDAELPVQRIVMALATVLTLVRRISDWMSTDALRFELLFIQPGNDKSLADEAELMSLLLQELRERGAAAVRTVESLKAVEQYCDEESRHNQVQLLLINPEKLEFHAEAVVVSQLILNRAFPALIDGHGDAAEFDETDDAMEYWKQINERLLELWV